jgi:hypothetical protein
MIRLKSATHPETAFNDIHMEQWNIAAAFCNIMLHTTPNTLRL